MGYFPRCKRSVEKMGVLVKNNDHTVIAETLVQQVDGSKLFSHASKIACQTSTHYSPSPTASPSLQCVSVRVPPSYPVCATPWVHTTNAGATKQLPAFWYFFVGIIVFGFYITNLFVGVMFEAFLSYKNMDQQGRLVSQEERRWRDYEKRLCQVCCYHIFCTELYIFYRIGLQCLPPRD